MKNGNHLFQHAAFPPPSEVILNQRSKSQLMPVCFSYSKPNRRLCSMRAEAHPWDTRVGERCTPWRAGSQVASPQTSFGVRLSRIHECVTNEPQRTSAGRLARRLKALEKLRWTMSVSLPLPRVQAMQSWITRWPRALCAVCVEKASSICFFIFSLLQLHYHFAVIHVIQTTSSSNANTHFHIKDHISVSKTV